MTARRCPTPLGASSFALSRHGAGQRVGGSATCEPARVFRTRRSYGSAGSGSRESQRWAEPDRARLGRPGGAGNRNGPWNHHAGLQGATPVAWRDAVRSPRALLGHAAGQEPAVAAGTEPRLRLGPVVPTRRFRCLIAREGLGLRPGGTRGLLGGGVGRGRAEEPSKTKLILKLPGLLWVGSSLLGKWRSQPQ